MNWKYVFIIRVILGFVFSTIISYFFFGEIKNINIFFISILIVGLAYFAEFLRNRKID